MNTAKVLVLALALLAAGGGAAVAQAPAPAREGVHDFDFTLGRFRTSIRRLVRPLTGSSEWVRYGGIKTDAPILGGAGSLEQIEADGPARLQLLTLRLYNSQSGQWTLNFSSSGSGRLAPAAVGEFRNGVGTFLSQEDYNGRTILVRQVWSDATPTSYHFEQAFSTDHGATWETNFIADLTRIADAPTAEG